MINHPYPTRLKSKFNPSANETSIPNNMAESTKEKENMANFLIGEHVESTNVDIEPQTSPHHSPKSPSNQHSHDIVQGLQHEIAILKAELYRANTIDSQRMTNKSDPSNFQPNVVYPMNNLMQSSTTNSTSSSIQYVLNIDPLQQMKDFVKPFFGNSEEDAIKWVDSIIHFVEIIRLPARKEDLCYQYAPAFLKANAYRWWNENKNLLSDWSSFKRMFIEQFGEKNEYLMEQQLNQRKQLPNEPVLQYYYDMIDLCHKCDPSMSDKQKVRKLILGLRLSLYQEAIKEHYSTPKQFLARVEQFENIEKLVELRLDDSMDKQEIIDEPIPSLMAQSSSHVRYQGPSQSFSSHPLSRSNTYPASHNSRFYPTLSNSPRDSPSPSIKNSLQPFESTSASQPRDSARMMQFECYRCGRSGHFARDCSQRSKPPSSQTTFYQQKNQ